MASDKYKFYILLVDQKEKTNGVPTIYIPLSSDHKKYLVSIFNKVQLFKYFNFSTVKMYSMLNF